MPNKPRIDNTVWLCDLTYTQQTIVADTIPMAIGCIASYTESQLDFVEPIKLFKYPELLCSTLDELGAPDIIGFSNYCWNENLSYQFAALIKKHFPSTIIVSGGPHYPTAHEERIQYLSDRPAIDAFIPYEGEIPFANLVAKMKDVNMDIESIKRLDIPSIHSIDDQNIPHLPELESRLVILDDIPSPYTSGRLDQFFDGKIMPLIQTTRGCPFTCTFCVEGISYYSKVRRFSKKRISEDVEYVSKKMFEIRGEGSRYDLCVSDSNFGMYAEDLDTCRALRKVRDKTGWPEYMIATTGKNKKERIIEAAKIMNGALRLSGSVQSLDKTVLENIKRKNISTDQLIDLGLAAHSAGVNSYSEIILGLPGDTKEAHFSTIQKVMDAGFNYITPWQLMLLPGSELGTNETKRQYKMKTKHRVLARCIGYYTAFGDDIVSSEIEEICIANSTFSFDDYIEARRLNLFLVIFNNDAVFSSVNKLFRVLDIKPFQWFMRMMSTKLPDGLERLFKEFVDDTINELWDSRTELDDYTRDKETVDRYIQGELGRNNLFYYRAMAITNHLDSLKSVARNAAIAILENEGRANDENITFLDEALTYHYLRVIDLFDENSASMESKFFYDIPKFEAEKSPEKIEEYIFTNPTTITFQVTDEQRSDIARHKATHGYDTVGIARILSKVYVRNLYRKTMADGVSV